MQQMVLAASTFRNYKNSRADFNFDAMTKLPDHYHRNNILIYSVFCKNSFSLLLSKLRAKKYNLISAIEPRPFASSGSSLIKIVHQNLKVEAVLYSPNHIIRVFELCWYYRSSFFDRLQDMKKNPYQHNDKI